MSDITTFFHRSGYRQSFEWHGDAIGFVAVAPPVPEPKAKPKPAGVGAIFRRLVKEKYGGRECAACRETANRMDALGPDGCEKEKAVLLDEIWERRDELKAWRWLAAKFPGAKGPAINALGALFDQAVAEALAATS